jgi:hypothetical protein
MKAARSEKPRGIARPNTSAKVGKSRRNRIRARRLTARQEKFLRLITTLPIPSLARAARQAATANRSRGNRRLFARVPRFSRRGTDGGTPHLTRSGRVIDQKLEIIAQLETGQPRKINLGYRRG